MSRVLLTDEQGNPITSGNPLPVSSLTDTTTNSTLPSHVMWIGASDGTKLQGLKVDANKNLLVGLAGSGGSELSIVTLNTLGDGWTASQNGIPVASLAYLYNGTTFDYKRNNTQGTALSLAARTVSTASPLITNYNSKGVIATLNITVASGTGGLTLRFLCSDGSNNNFLNTAPTALTATGSYSFLLYPGVSDTGGAGSGNVVQASSSVLPRQFIIDIIVGNSSSYTYNVTYSLIN